MRKVLAILVSFAVVFAMIPTMAFATEPLINFTDVTVSLDKTSETYTGKNIEKPTPTVKYNNEIVDPEKYTVSYVRDASTVTELKDAGEYNVVVTAKNDSGYTGFNMALFTIKKLDPAKVTASIPSKKVGSNIDYSNLGLTFKNGSQDIFLTSSDFEVIQEDPAPKVVLGSKNNVQIKYKGDNFIKEDTDNVVFAGKYSITDYTINAVTPSSSTVEYSGKDVTTTFTFKPIEGAPSGMPSIPTYTVKYTTDHKNVTGEEIKAKIIGSGDFMDESSEISTGITIEAKSIIKCKYTVETSTGEGVLPKVTVTDGTYVLVEGTDYKVQAGSIPSSINIVGKGNYKDSITDIKYTTGTAITSVSISTYSFTYNGVSQKPSVTVKAGEVTVPSTGYRIDWPTDTTNQGTKTFTVVGIGAYAGQITQSYIISKKDVSKLDISLSGTSFKYTGQYITPAVTVRDGSKVLSEGITKDYSLEYNSNVAPGIATVTVKMNGNYSGSKPMTFYIGKNPMTDLTITLAKDSYNYTGNEIRPTVTVKKGTTAVSTANYTVEYSNNKAVGTGTVTIIGKSEYYGTITKTFSIIGKTVANCTVTLSQTTYAADGTEKKPTVVVKDGTKTLVNGTDYTVTYANNKTPGQASVTITGKGAYGGTKTEYFTITGKYQYIEVEQDTYTKYPTSSPFKLAPTCNGDGTGFTFTSSDSSVASVAADGTVTLKAPGKAVITIATKGDKKYTPASETVTITVKPNKGSLAKLGTPAKKSLRVYINKRTGVDGYQVRYTRGTGYKYLTTKHVTSVYKTQYRTVRNLKSGYTYKVQVRAYKILDDGTKLYGSWSTVKSIKVK